MYCPLLPLFLHSFAPFVEPVLICAVSGFRLIKLHENLRYLRP
jgi:hypothetical protein